MPPISRRLHKDPHLRILAAVFCVIHASLFAYDLTHPQAFVKGDRGPARLQKIDTLFHAGGTERNIPEILLQSGPPGDYIFHGLLFALAGRPGVILCQVIAGWIALLLLYRLTLMLILSPSLAFISSLAYVFLCGSLAQPHLLVTEALFNPLLIAAFYCLVRAVKQPNARHLVYGALALSLAVSIRPVLLLYPVVLALVLAFREPRIRWRAISVVPTISWSLILAWVLFVFLHTGKPGLGESDHSLGLNLFLRVERMSRIAGFDLDPENRSMGIRTYARYALAYPSSYARTLTMDLANFYLNNGINGLAGFYLNRFAVSTAHWRLWIDIRDRHGLWGVVRAIVRIEPGFALAFFGTSLLWLSLGAIAAIGTYSFLKAPSSSPTIKAMLLSLPIYVTLFSLLSGHVRWQHRTPLDFVVVILFAFGLDALIRARRPRPLLRSSTEAAASRKTP